MLKKSNAVIVGLTSITLFTGCIALINNSDNQNKAIAVAFNQASPQLSAEAAPTGQGEPTKVSSPVVIPVTAEKAPAQVPTPVVTPKQSSEPPSVAASAVKDTASQTPNTPSVKIVPPTTSQTTTPSIKVIPPTTTKTRAS